MARVQITTAIDEGFRAMVDEENEGVDDDEGVDDEFENDDDFEDEYEFDDNDD